MSAPVTVNTRLAVYSRDECRCVYCGSTKDLTVDHLRPRSAGGSNHKRNLVTCCWRCNQDRGDMPLEKWVHRCRSMRRDIRFGSVRLMLEWAEKGYVTIVGRKKRNELPAWFKGNQVPKTEEA